MKTNEYVLCINNYETTKIHNIKGKYYKILEITNKMIHITSEEQFCAFYINNNNTNKLNFYNFFITLKQQRKLKLKQLNVYRSNL